MENFGDEIASIWIDARLNTKKLERDLIDVESKKKTLTIDVEVNDKPLYGLNRHIDKNIAHIKELYREVDILNSKLAKVPALKLDTSLDMSGINADLDKIKREITKTQQQISLKSTITVQLDKRAFESQYKSITSSIFQSNDLEKAITKSVKSAYRDIQNDIKRAALGKTIVDTILFPIKAVGGALTEVITAPFKTAFKTITGLFSLPGKIISKTFTGFFEGIGNNFANRFSAGFLDSIKKSSGVDLKKSGSDFARYSTVRGKQAFVATSRALNYERPSDFSKDISAIYKSLDNFIDPRKIAKNADKFEEGVAYLIDKAFIQKKPVDAIGNVFVDPVVGLFQGAFKRLQTFVNVMAEENPKKQAKAFIEFAKPFKEKYGRTPTQGEYIDALRPKREFQVIGALSQALSKPAEFITRVQSYKAIRDIEERAKKINVPDLTGKKSVIVTTGGFQQQRGKGAREIAAQAQLLFPDSAVIPVHNTYTDRRAGDTKSLLLDTLKKVGYNVDPGMVFTMQNFEKLFGTAFKGFNPDSIRIAAMIKAIKDKYPKMDVGATTFSGGTYPLEQAISYTTRMGINAKGIGLGAGLYGLTGKYNPNYRALIGKEDPLTFPFQFLRQAGNMTVIPQFDTRSSMEVHNPKKYFTNPYVQSKMQEMLPGFQPIQGSRGLDNKGDDVSKEFEEALFFFTNRRPKLEEGLKRAERYLQNPLTVPEPKLFENYSSQFADVLGKSSLFSTNPSESLRLKFGSQLASGDPVIVEAQNFYARIKNIFDKLTQQLAQQFKIDSSKLEQYTPEQQAAVIRSISKSRSEIPGIQRALGVMFGEREEGTDYSFYTKNKQFFDKRVKDLHGLINYLETKVFKGLPEEFDTMAKEYISFLNSIEDNIKKMGADTTYTASELKQNRDKLYMFGGEDSNEAMVVKRQIAERNRLISSTTTPISAREKYKEQQRLQRLLVQVPLGNVEEPQLRQAVARRTIATIPKPQIEISEKEILEAKNIAQKFREAYADIKTNLKTGNQQYALDLSQSVLKMSAQAKKDIANLRLAMGTNANIGTKPGNQLANAQSQIARIENLIKQNLAKSGIQVQAEHMGEAIPLGLAIGIKKETAEPLALLHKEAVKMIAQTRDDFGIQSPSKVFENIGRNIGEGLEIGLQTVDNAFDYLKLDDFFSHNLQFYNDKIKEFVSGVRSADTPQLDNFLGNIVTLGSGLFSFIGLTVGTVALKDFGKQAFDTALQFEDYQRQITAASHSSIEGAKNFHVVAQQAEDLNVNLKSALEGSTQILGAAKGTLLEGETALTINKASQQISAAYSLTPAKQGEINYAIQQMLSKPTVGSEELFQQLGDVVPGIGGLASRAQGTTPGGLRKQLKAGQIDSTEFLPKLAQQIIAETNTSISASSDTAVAALNRLDNESTKLTVSLGKQFLPVEKFFINIGASTLKTINQVSPQISYVLEILTLGLLGQVVKSIALMTTSFLGSRSALFLLGSSLRTLGDIAKSALPNLLLYAGVVEIFNALRIASSDLSGEFKSLSEASKTGLEDYAKTIQKLRGGTKELDTTLPQNGLQKFADSYTKRPLDTLFGSVPGINSLFGLKNENEESKKIEDSYKRISEIVQSTKQTIAEANNSTASSQIEIVKNIDKQLDVIQAKKRATLQENPDNTKLINSLQKQEDDLIKRRAKELQPTGQLQSLLQSDIKSLKKALEYTEEVRKSGRITQQEYDTTIQTLNENLDAATKKQEEFNEQIKAGVTSFGLMQTQLAKVFADLEDSVDKSNLSILNFKTNLSEAVANGGISQATEQYTSQLFDISSLEKQLELESKAIKEVSGLLKSDKFANRLNAFGVTENTGKAELARLAGDAENPQDKFILEQAGKLQESKLKVADLQNQIAQSRASLQRQLQDLTKQAADYYENITLQTQETILTLEKTKVQYNTSKQQNKLKGAILGFQDSMITQLVDSFADNLNNLSDISTNYLDAQSKLLQNTNQLRSTIKQGLEIERNIPGNEFKVPVTLDFENLDTSQIETVNQAFNSTVTNVENVNGAIENIKSNLDATRPVIADTTEDFEGTGRKTEHIAEEVQSWLNSLPQVQEKTEGISGALSGVTQWIQKAWDTTVSWIKSLLDVPSLLSKASETIGGLWNKVTGQNSPTVASVPEGLAMSSSATSQNKYTVYSGGKSTSSSSEVNPHHSGSAYTQRGGEMYRSDGGVNRLVKDIVLQIGNQDTEGTPVPSPLAGKVRRTNQFKSGGYGNLVEILDQQNQVIARVAHLMNFVAEDGSYVKPGQILGAQGNTGHSTGTHLHVELPPSAWNQYFNALKTGDWSYGGSTKQPPVSKLSILNPAEAKRERAIQARNTANQNQRQVLNTTYGKASYYWEDSETASGEKFNPEGLTAASNELPFGTMVRVTNQRNGKSTIVRVNDTGGFTKLGRKIDLSRGAARQIDMLQEGVGNVKIEVLGKENELASTQTAKFLAQASLTSKSVNVPQIYGGVNEAMGMARQTSQQQAQIIQLQSQQDLEKKRQDFIRNNQRALQQAQESSWQLEDSRRTGRRQITDLKQSIGKKSFTEQFQYESTQIDRQYSDAIRERQREIIKTKDRIGASESVLKTGFIDEGQANTLRSLKINPGEITAGISTAISSQLEKDKKALAELESEVSGLSTQKKTAAVEAKKIFDIDEANRRSQASFETRNLDIQKMQERLNILKEIQQVQPFDTNVQQIPNLEAQINLKQADLELDRNLLDVQEKKRNFTITPAEAQQQTELYKEQNIQRQLSIELTRKQANAEMEAAKARNNFEFTQQKSQLNIDTLKSKLTAINTLQKNKPFDFSLGDPVELQRQISLLEQSNSYQTSIRDINELGRTGQRTKEQVAEITAEINKLNESSLNNIQQEFESAMGDRQLQRLQLNVSQFESVNSVVHQPYINLLNARAKQMQDTGGNTFSINAIQRESGSLEENLRYQKEILSTQAQLQELKNSGINIGDANTDSLFKNLEAIHNLNLTGITNQFKTFGQTLSDLARTQVQGLSDSLASLVVDGGDAMDVIDGLFKSLLSGLIKTGLNAALGGLFGGGGIFGALFGGAKGGLIPNFASGGLIGLDKAFQKERRESGGRVPRLVVGHVGELMIPADVVENQMKWNQPIYNYAKGGIIENTPDYYSPVNPKTKKAIEINYKSQEIAGKKYVTEEDFQLGIRRAIEEGSNMGVEKVRGKMSNSTSFRRSVGI